MDRSTERRQRPGLDGWSIAAALGLLAVAFLIERVAPAKPKDRPETAKDLPPRSDTKRDAPRAGLATENEDRGRQATSPAEIPAIYRECH